MFTSRTLKPNEINHGITEKEALALLRILYICYTLLVSRDIKVLKRYSTLAWLTLRLFLFFVVVSGTLSSWLKVLWGVIHIMTQGALCKHIGRVCRFLFNKFNLDLVDLATPKSGRSFDPLFVSSLVTGDRSYSNASVFSSILT